MDRGAPTVVTAFMGLTSCGKITIIGKLSLPRIVRNATGRTPVESRDDSHAKPCISGR
ncbi:hypothetical protein ARTHRO9V_20183 [Arthrobacter sp. 9V]|nr:hypothetical protein ARTHRO9V_20183 [Arthrobacter sp. 9V]